MSTQTSSQNQAYQDALKILERYKTEGVTREETNEFLQAAIDDLKNGNTDEFAENVAKVSDSAIAVDEAFDRVKRGLSDMVDKYAGDFPDLKTYYSEWQGYDERWVTHLNLSRDVASGQSGILKRFSEVYIGMVQSIQTDQDRQDVILELEVFANEEHDESDEMRRGFEDLKRDIEAFVIRFDAFIEQTGEELLQEAEDLRSEIENIQNEIISLNEQIIGATMALLASLAAAATMIGAIVLAVTGTVLVALIGFRIAAEINLSRTEDKLAEVNRKQAALAAIKTEFDIVRPDIYLICDKLAMFGAIWASVRDQSRQFQETLKAGMDAINNETFKLQLQLAQELCIPLTAGLEKYATQLERRPKRASA